MKRGRRLRQACANQALAAGQSLDQLAAAHVFNETLARWQWHNLVDLRGHPARQALPRHPSHRLVQREARIVAGTHDNYLVRRLPSQTLRVAHELGEFGLEFLGLRLDPSKIVREQGQVEFPLASQRGDWVTMPFKKVCELHLLSRRFVLRERGPGAKGSSDACDEEDAGNGHCLGLSFQVSQMGAAVLSRTGGRVTEGRHQRIIYPACRNRYEQPGRGAQLRVNEASFRERAVSLCGGWCSLFLSHFFVACIRLLQGFHQAV